MCTIGHQRVFSLTRWFWQIPTEFHLLRSTWDTERRHAYFRLQGFHRLWRRFPATSTSIMFCNSLIAIRIDQSVPQHRQHKGRILYMLFGLGCSRFARHYSGNHFCFLFLGVLRCFSSPRWPCIPMDSVCNVPALPGTGCPIRRSPGLRLFPSFRGLSQVTTSFIAFWCQGIHHMLLVTSPILFYSHTVW